MSYNADLPTHLTCDFTSFRKYELEQMGKSKVKFDKVEIQFLSINFVIFFLSLRNGCMLIIIFSLS